MTTTSPTIDSAHAAPLSWPKERAPERVPGDQHPGHHPIERIEQSHGSRSCHGGTRARRLSRADRGVAHGRRHRASTGGTGQPAQGEPAAAQHAVRLQRLLGIGRAGRVVPAGLRRERRDHPPVEPQRCQDNREQGPLHEGTCSAPASAIRSAAAPRSAASSCDEAPAAAGSARTTTRSPFGHWGTAEAHTARSRRATRWRMTALPTDLLTISPTRGGSGQSSLDLTWRTSVGRAVRRPPRTAAVKSALRRIRWAAGSTGQAARRARPLRRRDDRIERPARVRIRSRKPWVLARRRLLGWNVRLDTRSSEG